MDQTGRVILTRSGTSCNNSPITLFRVILRLFSDLKLCPFFYRLWLAMPYLFRYTFFVGQSCPSQNWGYQCPKCENSKSPKFLKCVKIPLIPIQSAFAKMPSHIAFLTLSVFSKSNGLIMRKPLLYGNFTIFSTRPRRCRPSSKFSKTFKKMEFISANANL